jgi:S1-C subfamily serine protease
MASSLVIHIAAGEDKHTEVLSQERIRIGSGEDCDLRLRASSFGSAEADDAPRTLLELARSNGHYRVKDFDQSLGLTHNGKPLSAGAKIKDGDEVRYEPSGLALSFFPVRDLPALVVNRQQAQVAPFIENAAIESRATARRDDAKVFLREFTRELVREIRPTTKILTLLIALALVGGVLYLGFGLYNELKTSRRVSDDLRGQVSQLKDQISKTNSEITNLDKSNQNMRDPEVQTNEDGTVIQGGEEQAQLTPEGNGPVAEFQSVGSGFHVGDGYVLTNRHVAHPWLADERAHILNSSVRGQPRLKKLVAYFPDHAQPIALKFKAAAQREDLAVCVFDAEDPPRNLPALPLDKDATTAAVGRTVVLMGYPNGPDRLLALRDDAEAYMIRARCGASLESLLGCLSEKNRIQPLTTQGNITDLDVHRVVYDARTGEGGSGAPLFGQSGRVIGVNFAIFTENTASNFAVPIRYAFKLLERAGWVEPVPPAEANSEDGENSNQAATPRAGNQPPPNPSRPDR